MSFLIFGQEQDKSDAIFARRPARPAMMEFSALGPWSSGIPDVEIG